MPLTLFRLTDRLVGIGKSIACLQNGPFALYMNWKELHTFAKIFNRKTLKSGEVLMRQGDDATDFIIIESGALTVYIERVAFTRDDSNPSKISVNQSIFLSKKVAGEFIGERMLTMESNVPYKRTATVVAADKCKILMCTRKCLQSFLKEKSTVRAVMTEIVNTKSDTLKALSLLKGAVPSDEQLDRLGMLFRYRTTNRGDVLFEEGDEGSEMFVVSKGKIEISIKSKKEEDQGETIVVESFGPGHFFGEFALAMNIPRTATATSVEKSLLLTLESADLLRFLAISPDLKTAFDYQVAERITHHLRRFEVPFLSGFTNEQYQWMAKVCHITNVPYGQVICKEGDEGTAFYMIINGEVSVSVKGKEVSILGPAKYFGEVALVQNTKRTATVTATQTSVLLSCEKRAFDTVFANMPWVMADFQARLAPEYMTLEHVISHKRAIQYFAKQLEKEFSSENLEFVKEIQNYKLIPDLCPDQLVTARAILEKFLLPGALIEVNLPMMFWKGVQQKVCDQEEQKYGVQINNALFNECLEHILHLLSTDSLVRFKQGPLFREFVDSVQRYKVDEIVRSRARSCSVPLCKLPMY